MSRRSKVCAVMQPTYLPWLGYFDLISRSKDFIFLDNVKFNKSSYHHQNKILGSNGVISLSIPTHACKGRMDTLINEVEVDDSKRWKKKHLTSIEQSYRKTPYYGEIYPHIESIISSNIKNLSELNIELIKLFTSMLSLNVNFHVASRIEVLAECKVQKLVELCQIHQCDTYYSPAGSLDYLDTVENKSLFRAANIDVYFQQFETTSYFQGKGEFVPYMSVLDTLMYCGPEEARKIIDQGSRIMELQ